MQRIKEKGIVKFAIIQFAAFTYLFIMHIYTWNDLENYARSIGTLNIDIVKDSYFNGRPFLATFKYFIAASFNLIISVSLLFNPRLILLGLSSSILTAWLFISSLQLYYSILEFRTTVIIGTTFEIVMVILMVLIIMRSLKPLQQE